MNIDARLRRLEAEAQTGPAAEEWLDYMEAADRARAGRASYQDRAAMVAFENKLANAGPEYRAAIAALA